MSFSISERRAAATLLACAALLAWQPAMAGEATARGKKANITWIDEKGAQREEAAREIRFGYYTRVYLNVPKDGKNFKDEVHEHKGIQLGGDYTSFSLMDRIELAWGKDEATGVTRLNVKLIQANGKVREGGGTTLPGASHPMSPYVSFTVESESRRIEILPLASETDRAGKPRLVAIQFVL